ncbi:uncharacterized protein N7525_007348 [Penicillium rubens]|uniref:uncharacterized protein n=1 Tax=Penicillium rubens TaxID=1108849 RepID=UPI0023A2403B|nr:uncharacterized protein N7525_007348 [Penicillium rubens]KAJ5265180.1 hypothetical protein N7524_006198 [Penicillium chrysogenum]KAJ5829095.1 hypothetical protein N7525_007348 [Penicillium rubens]
MQPLASNGCGTVNADCEVLGIHGSRGALLKVTLSRTDIMYLQNAPYQSLRNSFGMKLLYRTNLFTLEASNWLIRTATTVPHILNI